MTFAPVDDDLDQLQRKPDQKKKTELQKPWFNWWMLPYWNNPRTGAHRKYRQR